MSDPEPHDPGAVSERTPQEARAEAVRDIQSRAAEVGLDPAFAVARLAYGSYVSLPRRYMYVETPKAACTSWKRLIAQVEGAKVDETAPPYHRETQREMLIHQRRHFDMPTLLDADADIRAEILSGSGGWLVFALTRNPFSRVVSVFENKVRLGEPGYRDLEARYGANAGHPGVRAAFSAYVAEVVADPGCRDSDAHLRTQAQLLMPALVRYTRCFKIEAGEAAWSAFERHIRSFGAAAPARLERANESVGAPWRSYYDDASAAIVAQAYAVDFELFDYATESWRGGVEDIVETAAERQLRAQIVKRNAMIDLLYDFLAKP